MDIILIGVITVGLFGLFLVLAFFSMKEQYADHRREMDERNAQSRGPTLQLNRQTVAATPVPGFTRRNWLANFSVRSLTAVTPEVVEFRFDWKMKIGGLISLGVGLFILAPLLGIAWEDLAHGAAWFLLIHAGGGTAFTLSGLYILLNFGAIRFDKVEGRMMVRKLFGVSELELARIKAVQINSGGWHSTDSDDYETFQLNLVLDDAAESRRNLVEDTELPPVRRDAQLLAEFLNVPFLDQMPQTPG